MKRPPTALWIAGIVAALVVALSAWRVATRDALEPEGATTVDPRESAAAPASTAAPDLSAPARAPAAPEPTPEEPEALVEPPDEPTGDGVRGRVLDLDGAPVAGARLWVAEDGFFEGALTVGTSDADGRFALRGLEGRKRLQASAPDEGISAPVSLHGAPRAADGARELELVLLGEPAALEGRVTDGDGAPVVGAGVRLACQSFFTSAGHFEPEPMIRRTDGDGRFAARDLRAGRVEVLVSAEEHPLWRGEVTIARGARATLDVRLQEGVTVFGVVSAPDGAPLRAQVSQSLPLRGAGFHSVITNSSERDGSYRLERIAPGEVELALYARIDGVDRRVVHTLAGAPGQEIEWNPVVGASRELRGRARAEDGGALSRWRVTARPLDDPRGVLQEERTDDAGAFVFHDCSEGGYLLRLYPPGERGSPAAELANVTAGPELVELVVARASRPSARVLGRLVDERGAPLEGATVQVGREDHSQASYVESAADGAFRSDLLAPGRYRLIVFTIDAPVLTLAPFALSADEELDLGELALKAPGQAELSIRRADGADLLYPRISLVDGAGVGYALETEDGRVFRSAALPPGAYRLRAHSNNAGGAALELEVRSGQTTRQEVVLPAGAPVTLRLRAPDQGRPPELVRVVVRDAQGRPVLDGRYPPDARDAGTFYYASTAYAPGRYAYEVRAPGVAPLDGELEVVDVGDEQESIELQLEPR